MKIPDFMPHEIIVEFGCEIFQFAPIILFGTDDQAVSSTCHRDGLAIKGPPLGDPNRLILSVFK